MCSDIVTESGANGVYYAKAQAEVTCAQENDLGVWNAVQCEEASATFGLYGGPAVSLDNGPIPSHCGTDAECLNGLQ